MSSRYIESIRLREGAGPERVEGPSTEWRENRRTRRGVRDKGGWGWGERTGIDPNDLLVV